MTTWREDENLRPSMVRNSLETTSVGSARRPYAPGSPPRAPSPLYANSSAGQIWAWKVMLSLPMK
jgi:hypothetical protein